MLVHTDSPRRLLFPFPPILDRLAGSRFRVHVKEAENLSVAGPADLVLSEDGITLHSVQTGEGRGERGGGVVVVSWTCTRCVLC